MPTPLEILDAARTAVEARFAADQTRIGELVGHVAGLTAENAALKGDRDRLAARVKELEGGTPPPPPPPPDPPPVITKGSLLGINTDWLKPTSPACPTINAILGAMPFTTPDGSRPAPRDPAGWPTADCSVAVHDNIAGGITGVYRLSFVSAGPASIGSLWGSNHVVRNQRRTADGVTTAEVEFRGGKVFALSFTGTAGGVRNLKLLRPGYDSDAAVFTDAYLKSKEPFGAVRLMNWTATNEAKVSRWGDRCKPTDAQWSDLAEGGPWEPWLDWAKQTGKGLWLNVPHLADDAYAEALAALCAARMGDSAPVYVEHTNEYWNWQFGQSKWIWNRCPEVAGPWKLNDDGKNGDELRHRYHAKRTVDLGAIFRRHLRPDRVRPVLTFQVAAGGTGVAADAMAWVKRQHGSGHGLYALAAAPYFGAFFPPEWSWSSATAEQVADHLLRSAGRLGTDKSNTTSGIRKIKAVADAHGLRMLAYEGGVDLAMGEEGAAARAASQLHPKTGEALGVYFDWWFRQENCGELFYFDDFSTWGRGGAWGLSDRPDKLDGPKFRAAAAAAAKYGGAL